MEVTFWGVRGSFPCPLSTHMRYGGNTSCVAVQCGKHLVVLDAGTGIRALGQSILRGPQKKINLLLSHVHWDHINGFPFFDPAYQAGFQIDIRAGHLKHQGHSTKDIMAHQMGEPTFPIKLDALSAELSFTDFRSGETFSLDNEIQVRTAPLSHPNEATAYRIEYQDQSMCYVTDTEHTNGTLDTTILNLIQGTDLVIYDSTYTDTEYETRAGWGHSTWQEGVRLARAAGAKRLAIFHHDPDHDDAFMDEVANAATALWSGAFVAKEGLTVSLSE